MKEIQMEVRFRDGRRARARVLPPASRLGTVVAIIICIPMLYWLALFLQELVRVK